MIEFKEGRYYLAMWYLEVPAKILRPLGGNSMLIAWREAKRERLWRIQHRNRYYCGEEKTIATALNSGDRFCWHEYEMTGDEAYVSVKASQLFEAIRRTAGIPNEPQTFLIQGDVAKFNLLIESGQGPEWLHYTRVERTTP